MKNIKPDDYYNNGGYEIARLVIVFMPKTS